MLRILTPGAGQEPKDVQDPEVLDISGFEDIIALMVHLLLLAVTIPEVLPESLRQ